VDNEGFVIVTWPKSQLVMDDEDFAECTLINDEAGLAKFGPAAYYVSRKKTEIGCRIQSLQRYFHLCCKSKNDKERNKRCRTQVQTGHRK
jgi:hypothetical protein